MKKILPLIFAAILVITYAMADTATNLTVYGTYNDPYPLRTHGSIFLMDEATHIFGADGQDICFVDEGTSIYNYEGAGFNIDGAGKIWAYALRGLNLSDENGPFFGALMGAENGDVFAIPGITTNVVCGSRTLSFVNGILVSVQ